MRHQAILNTHPAVVNISDDFGVFDANGNQVVINEEAVQAEIARLEAEAAASAYKAQRAREYPPLGDQLDALFHAGVFPPEMAAMIQAVKDKYPKGGN